MKTLYKDNYDKINAEYQKLIDEFDKLYQEIENKFNRLKGAIIEFNVIYKESGDFEFEISPPKLKEKDVIRVIQLKKDKKSKELF